MIFFIKIDFLIYYFFLRFPYTTFSIISKFTYCTSVKRFSANLLSMEKKSRTVAEFIASKISLNFFVVNAFEKKQT